MKKLMTVVLFAGLVSFIPSAMAQDNSGEETVSIKKKDLPADLLKKLEDQQAIQSTQDKIATYGKWVGLGKEVGNAVNDSLGALTSNADKFAQTGVGQFTMFIVAYKVLGREFIGFIVGFPLIMAGTFVFLWSYRKNCIVRSILTEVRPDKTKVYQVVNDGSGKESIGDIQVERFVHFICWFLFTILIWWAVF